MTKTLQQTEPMPMSQWCLNPWSGIWMYRTIQNKLLYKQKPQICQVTSLCTTPLCHYSLLSWPCSLSIHWILLCLYDRCLPIIVFEHSRVDTQKIVQKRLHTHQTLCLPRKTFLVPSFSHKHWRTFYIFPWKRNWKPRLGSNAEYSSSCLSTVRKTLPL